MEEFSADKHQAWGLKDWKHLVPRLANRMQDNHVMVVSGGVAFYFFLAVFPALASVISIYGLFTDLSEMQEQLSTVAHLLPDEAQKIIRERFAALIKQSPSALEWQLVLSILISLWITNVGTRALFRGVNIAYGEEAKRNFLEEISITLLFTLGGIVFYFFALLALVSYPALASQLWVDGFLQTFITWLKWPLLGLLLAAALTLVYHFAPITKHPPFKKVVVGALWASALWLAGSALLSWGVSKVGVATSYGPLAAVAILMLWFLLSSFMILLGAEINSAIEQEKKDNPQ